MPSKDDIIGLNMFLKYRQKLVQSAGTTVTNHVAYGLDLLVQILIKSSKVEYDASRFSSICDSNIGFLHCLFFI